MTKQFDPFTATLEEAEAQPNDKKINAPPHQWRIAQEINKNREYFEKNPLDGVAECVSCGLIAPDWLAVAFGRQYRKVAHYEVSSWDEAFGKPLPPGKHLSSLRLSLLYKWALDQMFDPTHFNPPSNEKLPRTLVGRQRAAKRLGITEKQVRTILGTSRKNTKGHKAYTQRTIPTIKANDPFSIAAKKTPK